MKKKVLSPILQFVREIKETDDIKEVAKKLSTGEWIAISATPHADSYLFALGKIEIKELESTHNSTFSRGV